MAKAKATKAKATKAKPLAGKTVVFTGKLAAMTRDDAHARVERAGGEAKTSVTKDLDYLVVGDDGSFLFGAGAKGEKILAAEKLQAKGAALQIIAERDFLALIGAKDLAVAPREKTTEVVETADAPAAGGAFAARGKKFLFTGKLAAMTRDEAKAKVKAIGGVAAGSVSRDLDYLVVGDQGSHLFGAGAKGEKILAAERLQAEGAALEIISETAFLAMAARAKK